MYQTDLNTILHEAASHLIDKHNLEGEMETAFLEGVTQLEHALRDQIPSYQLDWFVGSVLSKNSNCMAAVPYLRELVNII